MSKDFQKIGNANLIRDLSFNFSLLLYGFPMKENKYKIYQKLNSNQKTGMLVAHLKSVAKKLGFKATTTLQQGIEKTFEFMQKGEI